MTEPFAQGGCTCGTVRYAVATPPMIVHCCHCRWCQRESGAAFALNAAVETGRVALLAGAPETIDTPSASGKGQRIVRCPSCRVALWSHYAGLGERVAYVRVGTLDEPDRAPPDVHIFVASKQPWLALPADARAFDVFYDRADVWSAQSLERRRALLAAADAPGPAQRVE